MVAHFANETYRTCLTFVFLIETFVVFFLPIGSLLSFVCVCWLYSFYCFEFVLIYISFCHVQLISNLRYKWVYLGWRVEEQVVYFESHWAYFAGFGMGWCYHFVSSANISGFPFTVLTFFFPLFISSGIFALMFPLYIIMAICSYPPSHKDFEFYPVLPGRLRLFYPSQLLLTWVFGRIHHSIAPSHAMG